MYMTYHNNLHDDSIAFSVLMLKNACTLLKSSKDILYVKLYNNTDFCRMFEA